MLFWGLQKPLSDFNPLGMWGCALGPFEASALMATSPRKEERKKKKDTDRRCYVRNSWKLSDRKSVKSCVIYLIKKIKISAPSQTVAIERIAPNVRQGQPPTFVSQRSKLHPNRFTFGRVITGRVKAVLWAHWVNPILARSDASLRVNNNTFSSRLRIWRRLEPDFGKNFLS